MSPQWKQQLHGGDLCCAELHPSTGCAILRTYICCFEGSTLKYIKLHVLGSESMGTVSKVTDTVSDAELNIPDFPEKYKEVTSLKAKQELWKKFFG